MMQNPTEKSLSHPLIAMLGLLALSGLVHAAAGNANNPARLFTMVLDVLASFSAFVWYCRDSDMLRYRRSLWRNMLFIFLGILFVPWYLLRTRPSGKRFISLLSLGGFGLLMLVAVVVGAVLGFIVASLV
jgi:hypothetical protein